MYLFTGNSPYLIEEALMKWKHQFIEKYGDFNCVHFKDISDIQIHTLAENILGTSFLAEKKLLIIELSKDTGESIETFFLDNFDKIPEENIVLFSYPNPDKRKKFYKALQKQAEVKEFVTKDQGDVFSYFSKKYAGKIETNALQKMLEYKAGHEGKIASEIEKLLITKEVITVVDIESFVAPELEESIFMLVDTILNKNTRAVLKNIQTTLSDTNVYLFYNSLLANLRTSLFIMKLKQTHTADIGKVLNLGKRSFLVNKNYKMTYKELEKIFFQLVEIDKRMKTGKLIGSEDEVIIGEIEKALLL